MKFKITESQLKKLMTQLDNKQEVAEDETAGEGGVETNPDAAPKSGESTDKGKQTGASKWPSHGQQPAEGPSNVRGNTVWASKNQQPARGAANDISEQGLAGNPMTGQASGGRTYGDGNDYVKPETEGEYKEYRISNLIEPIKIPKDSKVGIFSSADRRQCYSTKRTPDCSSWTVPIRTEDGKDDVLYVNPPDEEYLRKMFPDGTLKWFQTPDGKVFVSYMTIFHPNVSSTHGPLRSFQELNAYMDVNKNKWIYNGFFESKTAEPYDPSKYIIERGFFGEDKKFWDTWAGFGVQVGAAILISVATFGIADAIGLAAGTAILLEGAAQAGFNLYIAKQQYDTGNDFGATCSVIFAMLPLIGRFSTASGGPAKAFGLVSKKTSQSLIEKLEIASVKSPEELASKIEGALKKTVIGADGKAVPFLNKEEQIALRKLRELQPGELNNVSRKFFASVDASLASKGIKWKDIAVPVLKKYSYKEIRNVTMASIAMAGGALGVKMYKLMSTGQNTFTPQEAEQASKNMTPEEKAKFIDMLGGKEKVTSAWASHTDKIEHPETEVSDEDASFIMDLAKDVEPIKQDQNKEQ